MIHLPLTDAQLLLLALVACAGTGWMAGLILVYDLAPAAARLACRCWRRWTA